MPEVSGEELRSKIEQGRMLVDDMLHAASKYDEVMRDMYKSTYASADAIGGMMEALNKSRYSFQDFMSALEKTNVLLYTTVRGFNELTQSVKSATNSTEGLISSMGTLGSKTLPEFLHALGMSAAGYKQKVEALKDEMRVNDEHIKSIEKTKEQYEDAIASIDYWEKEYGDLTDSEIKYRRHLKVEIMSLNGETYELTEANEELKNKMEEVEKTSKTFGESLTKILGPITLIVAATVAMTQAIDNAIKAEREVAYLMTRMGEGWSTNREAMARFQSEFVNISTRWGMLREELAKLVAPLAALGVGVGPGGIAKTFDDASKTIEIAANWTGGMMRAHGIEAGITTKAMGTLSTTFNIGGERLSGVFADIYTQGQKSVLGMQGYITNLTSMVEQSRRYGASLEGTMTTLSVWDEEVKKGILTLDNLVKLTTPAMMTTEQQAAIVTLMGQLAPKEAKALGIEGQNIYKDLINFQKMAAENGTKTAVGIIEMNKELARGGRTEEERTFLFQQLLKATTGIDIPLYQAVDALRDEKKLTALLEKTKPLTPKQVFSEMADSYRKTIAEGVVGGVEALRGTVLNIYDFMRDTWGGIARVEVPGGVTEARTAQAKGIAETVEKMTTVGMETKTGIMPADIGEYMEYMKKGKPVVRKQTGGYISETARYDLEAGEQVRRPGEGGGNISISLGGISVTVGDRGDLRGQLDEAFERTKRETIKEIENKWTESLVTH